MNCTFLMSDELFFLVWRTSFWLFWLFSLFFVCVFGFFSILNCPPVRFCVLRLYQRRRSSVVVSLPGLDVSPGDLFVSNGAADLLNDSNFAGTSVSPSRLQSALCLGDACSWTSMGLLLSQYVYCCNASQQNELPASCLVVSCPFLLLWWSTQMCAQQLDFFFQFTLWISMNFLFLDVGLTRHATIQYHRNF